MNSPAQNKKALLLSPFFSPEQISTGKYNGHLVNTLKERGYDVTVITSHPFYPEWRPQKLEKEGCQGATVHRSGHFVRYPRSMVAKRLILECWYALHVFRTTLRLGKEADLIIPVFPPNLHVILAQKFLKKKGRVVGIVHDLQAVLALRRVGLFNRLVAAAVARMEKKAFDCCERLIFLSQDMAREARETYGVDDEKCEVHYPFVTVSGKLSQNRNLQGIFKEGYVNVVYSGALGEKQDPNLLRSLFERAEQELPECVFHIFSKGPIFDQLKRSADRARERVRYHDLVDVDDLEELYTRSHIQIIPQAPGTSNGVLPSKLPNILAMGAAVFAWCDPDSEIDQLVRMSGVGLSVQGEDIAVMVESLKELVRTVKVASAGERQAKVARILREKFDINGLVEALTN